MSYPGTINVVAKLLRYCVAYMEETRTKNVRVIRAIAATMEKSAGKLERLSPHETSQHLLHSLYAVSNNRLSDARLYQDDLRSKNQYESGSADADHQMRAGSPVQVSSVPGTQYIAPGKYHLFGKVRINRIWGRRTRSRADCRDIVYTRFHNIQYIHRIHHDLRGEVPDERNLRKTRNHNRVSIHEDKRKSALVPRDRVPGCETDAIC